jgi:hypothetical protein
MYIVNRTQTDFDFETYIHCIYYGNMGHAGKSNICLYGQQFLYIFCLSLTKYQNKKKYDKNKIKHRG